MGRKSRAKKLTTPAFPAETVKPEGNLVVAEPGAGCARPEAFGDQELIPQDEVTEWDQVLVDGEPYSIEQPLKLYDEPISVGYLHRGMVHEHFMRSMIQMCKADPRVKALLKQDTCNLPLNRNAVIHQFLEGPEDHGKWLLFIDSDVGFPLWTAAVMQKVAIELEADMVCVPYQLANGTSTNARKLETGGYFTQGKFSYNRAYEIDAGGTGMMMLRRSKLEEMALEYADLSPWEFCGYERVTMKGKPTYMSEDYVLCDRMQKTGGRLVSYTGVVLSHMKQSPLVFEGLESQVVL